MEYLNPHYAAKSGNYFLTTFLSISKKSGKGIKMSSFDVYFCFIFFFYFFAYLFQIKQIIWGWCVVIFFVLNEKSKLIILIFNFMCSSSALNNEEECNTDLKKTFLIAKNFTYTFVIPVVKSGQRQKSNHFFYFLFVSSCIT